MNSQNRQVELEKIIKDGSKATDDYFELGEIYFFTGMFQEMFNLIEGLSAFPLSINDQAQACQQQAEALMGLGRKAEARAKYEESEKVLESCGESFERSLLLGRAHHTLMSLSTDSKEVSAHARNAMRYLKEALNIKEPETSIEDKNITATIFSWLADTHSKLGNLDDAIGLHGMALNLASRQFDRTWILVDMAVAFAAQGNFDKSEMTFKEAIEEARGIIATSKIYYEMGKMYISWNELSKAKRALANAYDELKNDNRMLNTFGFEVELLWQIGFVSYNLNEGIDVLNTMQQVLECINEQHRLYASSHLMVAHQYFKFHDFSKARDHYTKVLLTSSADQEDREVAKKYLATIPLDA